LLLSLIVPTSATKWLLGFFIHSRQRLMKLLSFQDNKYDLYITPLTLVFFSHSPPLLWGRLFFKLKLNRFCKA